MEESRTAVVAALLGNAALADGPRTVLVVLGVEFARGLTSERIEAAVARLQERIQRVLGDRTDARLVIIEPERRPGPLRIPA